MSIIAAFDHLVTGFRTTYSRRRTERMIRELTPELRKDIGWPGALDDGPRSRR